MRYKQGKIIEKFLNKSIAEMRKLPKEQILDMLRLGGLEGVREEMSKETLLKIVSNWKFVQGWLGR